MINPSVRCVTRWTIAITAPINSDEAASRPARRASVIECCGRSREASVAPWRHRSAAGYPTRDPGGNMGERPTAEGEPEPIRDEPLPGTDVQPRTTLRDRVDAFRERADSAKRSLQDRSDQLRARSAT